MTDAATLLGEARRELARFPAILDAVVDGLAPGRWRARPAPDEWAAVEIVCHLRDEEAEDFGARVRVILEGGTRFAPIDPEGWATARRYHEADPAAALAAFRDSPGGEPRRPGRRNARAPRGVRGEPLGPPALGTRSPRRLGRPRWAPPAPAGGDADAGVGGPLGAPPRGLRRTDPLPA